MAGSGKRSHDQSEDLPPHYGIATNPAGVAQYAKLLHAPNAKSVDEVISSDNKRARDEKADNTSEGWQVASRKSKKRKTSSSQDFNGYPSILHSPHSRIQRQVKLSDLQDLVFYLLADGVAPQWVSVQHHKAVRKVVVVMVPGLDRDMFADSPLGSQVATEGEEQAHSSETRDDSEKPERKPVSPDDYYPKKLLKDDLLSPVKRLADMFQHLWPILTPGDSKRMHSPSSALLNAYLPKSEKEKKTKGVRPPREGNDWVDHPTPITEFVATVDQLLEFEFALHPSMLVSDVVKEREAKRRQESCQTAQDGWIDTVMASIGERTSATENGSRESMNAGKNVVAIDCEMCETGPKRLELTRISLVGWNAAVLMDELVKPENPITNYVTQYSGITKEMLAPVTTTLKDIQERLLGILTPNTILIGHSVDSDLNALKITHHSIVDTSMLYPHPRGPPFKSSLKWLAQKYLSEQIQGGTKGHDSIEDARAALRLVQMKCRRGPIWGTQEATTESIFKRISRSPKPQATGSASDKCTGAAVDWANPKFGNGNGANFYVECNNDADVVAGVKSCVGDTDGIVVPGGGVEFVWARMRELEAIRGWSNSSKTENNSILRDTAMELTGNPKRSQSDPAQKILSAKDNLADAVTRTVDRIGEIYASLPPCTAFIVYSGSGDLGEYSRLTSLQHQFKQEYQVKKWSEMTVRWTDEEDKALGVACAAARQGIGFVTVK